MRSIEKLAGVGLAIALIAMGCGPATGTDSGTDMGGSGGPPASADYRSTIFQILTPTTLGLVNGLLTDSLATCTGPDMPKDCESVNILMQVTNFDTPTPTLDIGEGMSGANLGEFAWDGMPAALDATFDLATRNLQAAGMGTFQIFTVGLDTDGDMMDDLFIPLNVTAIPGVNMFDLFFNGDYSEVDDTDSRLVGAMTVDNACMVDIEIAGAVLNLLDILDGSTGDVMPPTLPPMPCAPGMGTDNVLPDEDTDGDGTNDAYRIDVRTGAGTVVITG